MQKYSGCGNTFIIQYSEHCTIPSTNQIIRLCKQAQVDGFIYAHPDTCAMYRFHYINCDGSRASMCGNGLRCLAHYMAQKFGTNVFTIRTDVGLRSVRVFEHTVCVQMCDFPMILSHTQVIQGQRLNIHSINTGVPHAVVQVDNVEKVNVNILGTMIRQGVGSNVTFVAFDPICIRTYERGVEKETMACGTGAVAAAALYMHYNNVLRVQVQCRVESLLVFQENGCLYLQGPIKQLEMYD